MLLTTNLSTRLSVCQAPPERFELPTIRIEACCSNSAELWGLVWRFICWRRCLTALPPLPYHIFPGNVKSRSLAALGSTTHVAESLGDIGSALRFWGAIQLCSSRIRHNYSMVTETKVVQNKVLLLRIFDGVRVAVVMLDLLGVGYAQDITKLNVNRLM